MGRDSREKALFALARATEDDNIVHVELLAIKMGLVKAKSLTISQVQVRSDSLVAVQLLYGSWNPLFLGDYPSSMRSRVGSRLPTFSKDEATLVKGSSDIVGINHYTTYYANIVGVLFNDTLANSGANTLPFKSGKAIGERAYSIWLYFFPQGMRSLMNYIKQKYGNPPIIITENGMDDSNNPLISIKDALKDDKRVKYHSGYLSNLLASIKYDPSIFGRNPTQSGRWM
ncbi:beta-glucosidase 6-like [Telopea speciosissima]|uniref:beta-glucosidase 6-like n=1 Tax=Telopea speciosissima TaxID=54955 RepID=UPI001CC469E4|nr:beta-glucosidase 6-like [Telopea speciosissima]